jgi:hypothetical protein
MTAFLDAPRGHFYKKITLHYFALNFYVYDLVDRENGPDDSEQLCGHTSLLANGGTFVSG